MSNICRAGLDVMLENTVLYCTVQVCCPELGCRSLLLAPAVRAELAVPARPVDLAAGAGELDGVLLLLVSTQHPLPPSRSLKLPPPDLETLLGGLVFSLGSRRLGCLELLLISGEMCRISRPCCCLLLFTSECFRLSEYIF